MDKYTIYRINGYVTYSGVEKKPSLSAVLEFSKLWDSNTVADLFNNRNSLVNQYEKTIEQIKNYIENGFIIFPVSKTVTIRDIKMYINNGFTPLFMKSKEYNKLRKEIE